MEARVSCLEVEAWATEYAEGVLGKAETRLVDEHLAECAACRAAMQDMRQALALCRKIDGALVPAGIVQRIIEETTGKLPWRQRLRLWIRPMLEPRIALSVAAALISLSMVLHATGADVSKVRLSDLAPAQIMKSVNLRAHQAVAKVEKYYNGLRVVYQIQTQLQTIREAKTPQEPKQTQQPRKQPQSGPTKQLNKWSRQTVYTAGLFEQR
jgi:hypothetical protein